MLLVLQYIEYSDIIFDEAFHSNRLWIKLLPIQVADNMVLEADKTR
jgi:hypothetical protein